VLDSLKITREGLSSKEKRTVRFLKQGNSKGET
jgi:hypothetical protein